MLIHEFVTNQTTDILHERNSADLNLFVRRLSHGRVDRVGPGEICGPFEVPGAPLCANAPALFIGKVVRTLRARND